LIIGLIFTFPRLAPFVLKAPNGAEKFKHNPPTALAVIVGKSSLAYRREEDGVYVLPLTALKA
jgi:hypothetical protein